MTDSDIAQCLRVLYERDCALEEVYELRKDVRLAESVLAASKQTIDDLTVQCKFWRQAAEHAVDGWNKLEDEHETLLESIRAIDTVIDKIVDDRAEWAPPREALEIAQSLPGFTIVETETTRHYNTTRVNTYNQIETVVGYLFVAVRDAATTKWCRSRNGMVVLKGTKEARASCPPCHWNCRSELLPLSRLNPAHRKLLENMSLRPENRVLVPLPDGWNQAA